MEGTLDRETEGMGRGLLREIVREKSHDQEKKAIF